jgi:hypothetical protein
MVTQFATDVDRASFAYAGNFGSLLPLGVLRLSSFVGIPGPAPLAPDGWHWAPPLPWIESKRGSCENELEFLSHHDFIRGTYKMIDRGTAVVRIYVIPEDCESYLVRSPGTECRGRALLQKFWGRVDPDIDSWNGSVKYEKTIGAALLADDDLSLNLSAIFNSLPSPQPDHKSTAEAPPIVRDLLELSLEDDGVPGFKSQLYHYQRQSVWKMLQRELLPQKRPDPRLRKWIGPTGILAWINMDDMTFFSKQQYVDDVRGGILCEEMGTGKTVHILFQKC